MSVKLVRVPLAEDVAAPRFEFYFWSQDDRAPVAAFLAELQEQDLDKVKALLVRVARYGLPVSNERYKRISGSFENLHEFKLHQVRLYFFRDCDKIVFTEGELKKQNRTNQSTLKRADCRRKLYFCEKE